MEMHSRFDEEHRDICEQCRADYFDFCLEQVNDAYSDEMAELELAELELAEAYND